MKFLNEEIQRLWSELEDVTFREDSSGDLLLNSDWFIFKRNIPQREIWSWFGSHFEGGIHALIENQC